MNGIICDCGIFLNPTHRGKIKNTKIYSCTCGRKWIVRDGKQTELTKGEYKRISYMMDKY